MTSHSVSKTNSSNSPRTSPSGFARDTSSSLKSGSMAPSTSVSKSAISTPRLSPKNPIGQLTPLSQKPKIYPSQNALGPSYRLHTILGGHSGLAPVHPNPFQRQHHDISILRN